MLTLPLFSQIVLGALLVSAAPAPRAVARRGGDASNCPYPANVDNDVALDGTVGKSIKIRYIGAGSYGCAYKVVGGWTDASGKNTPAVAKTPRKDRSTIKMDEKEMRALNEVHELLAHGKESNKREWAIIKFHEGRMITETQAWKNRFPKNYNTDTSPAGVRACDDFLKSIYEKATASILEYVHKYEWDPNDINWENYLFSDDLGQAAVIDWGLAIPADRSIADALGDSYLDSFEKESDLPLRDNKYRVQGICQSKQREKGVPFENPLVKSLKTHF